MMPRFITLFLICMLSISCEQRPGPYVDSRLNDNTLRTIVSIHDFNFNWQWLYRLKNPISVPKGSKIIVEGIYDNTFQNPLNPDPYKELHYGIQSTDEMLIGFFNYTLDK